MELAALYMRFAHLNVRSLTASFSDFSELAAEGDYEVVALSETWLNDEIAPKAFDCLPLAGYQLLRKDRLGRGGGVALYIKDKYKVTEKFSLTSVKSSIEHIWVELKFRNKVIAVGSIYRPPNRKKS